MQVGDKISFGCYDWRVLDIQNDVALIITECIIEQRAYHDAYKDITWADCSLRKYLNGEFYNKFNATDKARIIPVSNKNPDNQWYGSKGGEDTQDKIFLLSIEEAVCQYFGDSSSKLLNPGKNQRYWFERKDQNNSKRIAMYKSGMRWWWLRSPGRVNIKAVYVHGDGNIGIQGNNILKGNISEVMYRGGVRPALWLKL
ncbi:DUF6273 domain-containing protein [Cellulosilyticum sp. I15G10I2]|uniref:DUF6273 domain-containing protein n=1 Tax=Cellulosilyticum sp. I15G10I2 TaxID=1892843 RepID=UPI00085CBCBA|nr:DUF6273 domain-containing protein [Cellulosilyticum sp. I15G10I2]